MKKVTSRTIPLPPCAALLALGACHTEAASLSSTTPTPPPATPSAPAAAPATSAEPPPLPEDVARAVAFLAKLPRCAAGAERTAVDVRLALGAGATSAQAVIGRLVPTGGGCTEMECSDPNGDPAACCNHCDGLWAVRSKDGTKRVSLATRWAVMDCHRGAFWAKAGAGVDVIVTGTLTPSRSPNLGDALVSDAHVCVLGDSP